MGQYKCCCCIPVRAGVLIIALITAAAYIAATVGLFLSKPTAANLTYDDVAIDMRVVNGIYYTFIGVCIAFALAALFGVLGSIVQQRKMIAIFKISYWFVAIIEFILILAAIIAFAVKKTDIINNCAAFSSETVDTCSVGYRNGMIILSVVGIVVSFIQFYFATAISAYATRLRRTNMHEKLRNLEDFPEPPSKTEFF